MEASRHAAGGAILVLPTTTDEQISPVGGWISTAGWADAAVRVLGDAWVVTRRGVLRPDEVRAAATASRLPSGTPGRRLRRMVPTAIKTALKDVREARRAAAFRIPAEGPWTNGAAVSFVWQRHDLFHTAGLDLAERLAVPSVLFVPALIVEQARHWGIRRAGWGRWLERAGELPALLRADLVACGSEVVADQVRRLGVPDAAVLVTPTGADLQLFGSIDREAARRELGLRGSELAVAWTGSFRRFHALEVLVEAAALAGDITLVLVGDGPERPAIEDLARERGVRAHFVGTVPHDRIPAVLAAADAGAVVARAGEQYHYSPLKLAEYLAAGLPVVAPQVGQLAERLDEGRGALLVPPGDAASLAGALQRLRDDLPLRKALAQAAAAAAPDWSWDESVRSVLAQMPRFR